MSAKTNSKHQVIDGPQSLLGGKLVRDARGGCYRRIDGEQVLVVDAGKTVLLTLKTIEACHAAIELAATKGLTTIRLRVAPAMLARAQAFASQHGITVDGRSRISRLGLSIITLTLIFGGVNMVIAAMMQDGYIPKDIPAMLTISAVQVAILLGMLRILVLRKRKRTAVAGLSDFGLDKTAH